MSYSPTLPSETIDAIVGGYHNDPFSILGPHIEKRSTVVRVFEPGTASITLHRLNGKKGSFPMQRVHDGGFYESKVGGTKLHYDLEITYHTGVITRRADTYSFGSTLSDQDRYLLGEGTDLFSYNKLGAQLMELGGVAGTRFALWAPNAERVSVVGNFNLWDGRRNPMRFHPGCGIWELFIPGIDEGEAYKYELKTRYAGYVVNKTDPQGFFSEVRPNTASVVWNIDKYTWDDSDWMDTRAEHNSFEAPMSIYEVHIGSWQRKNANEWLTYNDLSDRLIPYVKKMGFTHIELMPVAEHPFDGSWGYQVTGYFAPTSRFGTPEQFMAFVDKCHQNNIGVIVDWVPAHFPKDEHGLGFFDGTHLYEHADPRQGEQPDWGTYVFNFDRGEVRQFLISNALFWLDKYHIDGLRVDAVASMLYLDFSREDGQWVPNVYGGRENIGAIHFLRSFNDAVHKYFPGTFTAAEESTDFAGVTHDTAGGGLGFDMKWNMGWMHDSLQYMSSDPIYRMYQHGTLTFSLLYAFSEQFILPFSHDEVVHLKKSMLDKMPGDGWQKFANLRLLYGYMWMHPGKKLLFMGCEFGQGHEWTEEYSLDWHLVQAGSPHEQISDWVRDLNHFYTANSALYVDDKSWGGFEWLEVHDSANSVLAFVRRGGDDGDVVVVCNFTPVVRQGYRLGVPQSGTYIEVLNSDQSMYGGSNVVNDGDFVTDDSSWRGQPSSIQITLPPLGVAVLKTK